MTFCRTCVTASLQDLGKCSASSGHFLHYSLHRMLPNVFEKLVAKQSVVIHHDQMIHPLLKSINKTHALMMRRSIFYEMARSIAKILSCYSLFITLCNGLKMSEYEAYWLTDFFDQLIFRCTPRNEKQKKESIAKN